MDQPTKKNTAAVRFVHVTDRIVQTAIDIVFVILLLIGVYFLVDTIYVFNHAKADEIGAYRPESSEDLVNLRKVAKDAIAWITIDDTNIDYPIMQGKDNVEYLNKDPYGEYSLSGSIYLDSRNASDFTDYYSLIYGHHMSGGYMFGALDEFEDPEFFDVHRKGTLITKRGSFPVTVMAFFYTDAGDEIIFEPDEDQIGLLDHIKEKSLGNNYYEIPEDEKIVALTTCRSPASTRRMVVILTIDEEIHTADENDEQNLKNYIEKH